MKAFLVVVGILAVAGGAGQLHQWQQRAELQADLAILRESGHELARLRGERSRLQANQLPEAQLQQMRVDRAAIARLRREIESLKGRIDTSMPADEPTPPAQAGDDAPSVTRGTVAEKYLRNMGRATPAAALETAFWAATGGDIDTLVGILALEGDARTAAEQILASLPASVRSEYRTPEHLVALLTAKDIPLTGIQITPPRKDDPAGTRVLARVPAADGKSRTVAVSLRQYGSDWKLVVPRSAVEKYGQTLKVATAATGR